MKLTWENNNLRKPSSPSNGCKVNHFTRELFLYLVKITNFEILVFRASEKFRPNHIVSDQWCAQATHGMDRETTHMMLQIPDYWEKNEFYEIESMYVQKLSRDKWEHCHRCQKQALVVRSVRCIWRVELEVPLSWPFWKEGKNKKQS